MENNITTNVVIQIEGSLNTRGSNSSEVDENVGADHKERKQVPKVITLVLESTWWFICIVSLLIATLSTKTLFSNLMLLGMHLWKWFAFLLIISCTPRLVAWFVDVVIFLIVMNFVMSDEKKKVLYFVYGMKTGVVSFLCSSSALLGWIMLIDWDIKGATGLIYLITSTLSTFVIGAAMWIFKIVILMILSCSFHDKKFFEKIQLLIFHQCVLQTLLWGRPSLMFVPTKCAGIIFNIGVQLKWIKKAVVNMLGGKRLFNIYDAPDKIFDDETLTEKDTKSLVSRIFKNLAKNDLREIYESDLLQLMKQEHIPKVLKLFEGAFETKCITETSLKDWTMKVYNERKTLVHLLNDTNTAIKELNNIVSLILLISISILWLVLMGFVTNKVLLSILSSLFMAVFTFGNTNNTICEGIMFVFVRHPFDKGDICLIDDKQVIDT